ncbi:GntR family transcriptional regulator [Pseudomonas sp. DC3000-4b1]|uniref:GntR family transcriptional regulator n=1 Tax=unclassified Pseudomonas TaxID=196821 RepID=UPI003CFBB5AC
MPRKPSALSVVLAAEQLPAHLARSIIQERLRIAILEGRLPTGTAVRQQELATMFGVSRMPVREALRQLEAQGLLAVEQHKGAVVAPLITWDATETYELRILLESEALRQSVPRLTESDLDEADALIERMEAETDYSAMGELNKQFHLVLYRRAPNRRLMTLVETGLDEEERFLRFNLKAMGLGKVSQDDHRALAAAARAGDTERCVSALTEHLQRGIEAITRFLAQGQAT